MALKSRLGFGMMRLPVKNGNPTDFDYDELNRMVDTFIEAGYTYFDTSYVYHNGKSEEATRKAVVERYPRDAFLHRCHEIPHLQSGARGSDRADLCRAA